MTEFTGFLIFSHSQKTTMARYHQASQLLCTFPNLLYVLYFTENIEIFHQICSEIFSIQ